MTLEHVCADLREMLKRSWTLLKVRYVRGFKSSLWTEIRRLTVLYQTTSGTSALISLVKPGTGTTRHGTCFKSAGR